MKELSSLLNLLQPNSQGSKAINFSQIYKEILNFVTKYMDFGMIMLSKVV